MLVLILVVSAFISNSHNNKVELTKLQEGDKLDKNRSSHDLSRFIWR